MPTESAASEPMIAAVIHRYFPDWEPPRDNGTWSSCRCPWHGDEVASASVSYELDAFCCHGCGVKGDAIKIVRDREKVSFAEAVRILQEVTGRSDSELSPKPKGKSRRRVFADEGSESRSGTDLPVGVRGRRVPWS